MGLAMSLDNLAFIQNYFKETEKRNPTETEIKVLDTYWSDHYRHTTFETYLENITFEGNNFEKKLQEVFTDYINLRVSLGSGEKPVTLMDLATIMGRSFYQNGKLSDQEISEEIKCL